jgi:hypothetical protein
LVHPNRASTLLSDHTVGQKAGEGYIVVVPRARETIHALMVSVAHSGDGVEMVANIVAQVVCRSLDNVGNRTKAILTEVIEMVAMGVTTMKTTIAITKIYSRAIDCNDLWNLRFGLLDVEI